MAKGDSDLAWVEFDKICAAQALSTPWQRVAAGATPTFAPNFELLEDLLAVPLRLGFITQSGIPAKAVDVWVAHELRRAGFEADEIWPRATTPRVLPREVAKLRGMQGMLKLSNQLFERIDKGQVGNGVTSANAKILGKAYEKQVDVVMAQWARGPELMISTKRMDSSFGKNALNRIEESYGDAKNLRGRHPLAATGFLFVMRSTAFDRERDTALRLMDLLAKLAQEPDAYDATGIVITEWTEADSGRAVTAEIEKNTALDVRVSIRHDLIPPALEPGAFLQSMVDAVLGRTPIDFHKDARLLRGDEVPASDSPELLEDEDAE